MWVQCHYWVREWFYNFWWFLILFKKILLWTKQYVHNLEPFFTLLNKYWQVIDTQCWHNIDTIGQSVGSSVDISCKEAAVETQQWYGSTSLCYISLLSWCWNSLVGQQTSGTAVVLTIPKRAAGSRQQTRDAAIKYKMEITRFVFWEPRNIIFWI